MKNDPGVHELFDAQTARTPDAVALVCGDRHLSYAALQQCADAVACDLRGRGVRLEQTVAIGVDRSLALLVAVLGVLKTGAAYVPIDRRWPPGRVAEVLTDSRARFLIANGAPLACAEVGSDGQPTTFIELPDAAACATVAVASEPRDLFSIIYTSGSMGKPKGVLVETGNVLNQFRGLWQRHALDVADVSLAYRPATIIGAAWDYLGPLLRGVRTVVMDEAEAGDAAAIWRAMARHMVTHLWSTPTMVRLLLEQADGGGHCGSLRLVTAGGESMDPATVARWHARLPHARLVCSYGTTECVYVAQFDTTSLPREASRVPVGQLLPNVAVYVLDDRWEPVAEGARGNVCVGGGDVTRGYLGDPALTAARYLPNPFSGVAGDRMYWTGDWGLLARGRLEIIDRRDHQVKIRGYRIELGDIEAAVRTCESVAAAVVVARAEPDRELRLVVYAQPRAGADLSVHRVRAAIAERLPPYMMPSHIVLVPALPLTGSGKIDRQALAAAPPPIAAPTDAAPPGSANEAVVAGIWEEVLGLDHLGVDDDFLELGGDSLAANRMLSRVAQRCGVLVPLAALYDRLTVRALAAAIDAAVTATPSPTRGRS